MFFDQVFAVFFCRSPLSRARDVQRLRTNLIRIFVDVLGFYALPRRIYLYFTAHVLLDEYAKLGRSFICAWTKRTDLVAVCVS